MWEDEIVEKIRAGRQAHAEKYNNNLQAIFKALKEEEQQSGRRVVSLPAKRAVEKKSKKAKDCVAIGISVT